MQYLNQIAKALKDQNIPFWKANVIMTQARLESGQFNETNPSSIFVQSGYTNPFGMMYPSNSKRYEKNGGNVSGYFVSKSGKRWATYRDVYNATLDRIQWDKLYIPATINNVGDYIAKLEKLGYWVENGVDAGYTKSITTLIKKYEAEHEQIFKNGVSGSLKSESETTVWKYVFFALASIFGIGYASTR
jgi:hypothetical protein